MHQRRKKRAGSNPPASKRPNFAEQIFQEAIARAARGFRKDADILLRAVRGLNGQDSAASDLQFAGSWLKAGLQVTAAAPGDSAALSKHLFDEAVRHHQALRLDKAEDFYRALLVLAPAHAMVWSNLAAILTQTGDVDEAISACRKALDLSPDHLNARINLAGALQKNGLFPEAAETFRQILRSHPNRLDLCKPLGGVLELAGQCEDALAVYEDWIARTPKCADAHVCKAEVLRKLDRADEAIAAFAHVTTLDPDNASAHSSIGILMALHSLSNDLDGAANHCLRAASLRPDSPPILNNLGVVLQIRGDMENALLIFGELIRIDPDFAPAYCNIGSILSAGGRYDEAEDSFLRALARDGSLKEARIEITKVRRNICNWEQYEADSQTIRDLTGQVTNFMIVMMASSYSGDEQLTYARAAMAKYNGSTARIGPHHANKKRSKIRIGYISADFKDHPVGRLVPDLIRNHDREAFEIIAYSIGKGDKSSIRQRLIESFDRFIDLQKVSDEQAATRILQDEIDVLIDLTGPTADSRFEILALRPAPIQISFLGMPGTIGADCIDYMIADSFLVPPDYERFYHEKIVRLPSCYQPSDSSRRLIQPLPSRAACGLPETGFVFCSFNSPLKITPVVFDTWLRLLKAVPGSVLWLYCKSVKTKANLEAYAEKAGIAADRIIFTGAAPTDVYLTRLACADLFLDTFPYAAGATCNDALWAGLPVITCVGETYVSRMAGSLLTTLSLPELIATSMEEYESRALDLATHPKALETIRQRLARSRAESDLFDMTAFTKALEHAYKHVVTRADEGLPSRSFDVPPSRDC